MTARVYDLYDLNSPMVTPYPPPAASAPATTAAAPRTATARRNSDRLLRVSAYLLTFAGVLFLAALAFTVTPLATIDMDYTAPFLVVAIGVPAAIVFKVTRWH